MTAKYTPGPWVVLPESSGTMDLLDTTKQPAMKPNGFNLRAVEPKKFGGTQIGHVGKAHNETDEANATLIAAAPDMAEAIQVAIEHMDFRFKVQGSHGTLDGVYEQLTQAYAKATGASE